MRDLFTVLCSLRSLHGCQFWVALICARRVEQSPGGRKVAGLIHPECVRVSLSETPNPQMIPTSRLVPCTAANHRWCANGRMRTICCTALWIKALHKCRDLLFILRRTHYSPWHSVSCPFTGKSQCFSAAHLLRNGAFSLSSIIVIVFN